MEDYQNMSKPETKQDAGTDGATVSPGALGLSSWEPCEYRLMSHDGLDEIRIVQRRQPSGPSRWAVLWMGRNLTKRGEWEYEPIPSSRDEGFFERCRFDTPESAAAAFAAIR